MSIPVFTISAVGVTYDARQKRIAAMEDGAFVYFKREPNNSYDPLAIAILNEDGEHLGYVGRNDPRRAQIRCALEGGFVIARAQKVGGFKKWNGTTASYGLRIQFYTVDSFYKYEPKDEDESVPSTQKRKNSAQKPKGNTKPWKDQMRRHHKGRYTYHEIEAMKERSAA